MDLAGKTRRIAVENATTDAALRGVRAALASMTDPELDALVEATYKTPRTAPKLLAWLDSACAWQVHRRAGHDYELQAPKAAIPPEEDAVSIDAAILLRRAFLKDSAAVRA